MEWNEQQGSLRTGIYEIEYSRGMQQTTLHKTARRSMQTYKPPCWLYPTASGVTINYRFEQGYHTFSKTTFHTFSIPFWYWTSISSIIFIFTKFYSRNTMRRTSAKLSSAVMNKIWINKWMNLELSLLFQNF